ncbi:MAG: ABC transporter ATP-binding protein [Clostridia bacterium]|nr:ABC transporter ATP-binding protein [Clostridia bacterium]
MEKSLLIELHGISKSFDGETVLDNIDLDIHDKEFVTLLGPSGCGKTTTLRIIAGFETPDLGELFFEGQDLRGVPPYKRNINTVFQRYALFPHLNVYDNIAFGLKLRKVDKTTIAERVAEMLRLVNLVGFDKRYISTLSGGQQQRVAIARALINEPRVLLLDEPLGALDLKLRKDMQNELKRIQHLTGITFIYVTHDQEEALSMSDTVVVMAKGKIQQIGTPEDIYNEPVNAFVADFIGESNILDGRMIRDRLVSFAGQTFDCVDAGFEPDEPVDVVIRPEDVDVIPTLGAKLTGKVTSVTFKGDYYEIIVDVCNFKWMVETSDYVAPDALIGLKIDPDAIHVMRKSEFSGQFGDYSTFSEEADEMSDPDIVLVEEDKDDDQN